MKTTTVVGIDPGLVHTGVVTFIFWPHCRSWSMKSEVVNGLDLAAIEQIVADVEPDHIYIEAYRPRSNFKEDTRMVEAIGALKQMPHATAINNTGVKKVVTDDLMKLLHCWKFSTVTHHQDLRSAARIGLYGMLKSLELNELLTRLVADELDKKPWNYTL